MTTRPAERLEPDLPAEPSAEPALRRAEEIRQVLQAEIESGTLVPGTALDEKSLTERFGVSRTPVREALQQLATLELVRMAPRQGALVARLSVNKVRGMLELISELEGVVAMLATRRQMLSSANHGSG